MAYSLRYWGEFSSIQGTLYRVEIWQNSDTAFIPSEIGFAYDEPAEIEWNETDKLEPVQGSCLTLTLDSDSDRKFLDLYTIDVDSVRADIYRDGTLYWSGMLDPELYEEPFSYKQGYDVTITFSDFAILDRKRWEGREIYTVQQIVDKCLAATGIRYSGLMKYISTQLSASEAGDLLADCSILGENFYDEDNEPMTLREVLEETLRPFALRIVQKNGQVHIYDLNALYGQSAQTVEWSDVDASIEADKVYNNVTITFSPYASATLIDGSLDPDEVLKDQPVGESGYSIYTSRGSGVEGFCIVSGEDTGVEVEVGDMVLSNHAVPFRIDPEYSGSSEAGVMWGFRPITEWNGQKPISPLSPDDSQYVDFDRVKEIIRLPSRYVTGGDGFRLRVSIEVLFDVRYNPFEDAGSNNESGNWDTFQNWVNYGYIPVQILLLDASGTPRYFYDNNWLRMSDKYGSGVWGEINEYRSDEEMISWLCFYSSSNRTNQTGFGGWQNNKRFIGHYAGGLPSIYSLSSDGEYLPALPISGYIEFRVFSGVWRRDNNDNNPYPAGVYDMSRWLLYKDPKIEVVKSNGRDIDEEDVTVTAWVNRQAKESFDISTIVGTSAKVVPSGRGYVLRSGNFEVLRTFCRGGVTDSLERLLAGTVYSQYASRKHILSGTVEVIPTFGVFTDRAEPGQYMLLSEVQHLLRGESEIRMAQFSEDNFEGIEYEE